MPKSFVQIGEFKGHKTFSIWMEYENGNKIPAISFGVKKAESILKHLEELKQFIEENKGENNGKD